MKHRYAVVCPDGRDMRVLAASREEAIKKVKAGKGTYVGTYIEPLSKNYRAWRMK